MAHVQTSVTQAISTLQLNEDKIKRANAIYEMLMKDYPTPIGKAISKKQRDDENLRDPTLVYGEIHFKTYALTFEKIRNLYSGLSEPGGVFVDIGSGTGKPVFGAILMHEFDKATGIEILDGLHKLSNEILDYWNKEIKHKVDITEKQRDTVVEFICGNAMEVEWEKEATVAFANSTCFSDGMMKSIAEKGEKMKPGSFFVTFTRRLPSKRWQVLEYERHLMSWGEATVFIHKLKPPSEEEDTTSTE